MCVCVYYFKIELNDPISKAKYTQIDEKIEQMSHLIELILMKITIPGCLIPVLITTAINFFIHNLGNESFYMQSPMMSVIRIKKNIS